MHVKPAGNGVVHGADRAVTIMTSADMTSADAAATAELIAMALAGGEP